MDGEFMAEWLRNLSFKVEKDEEPNADVKTWGQMRRCEEEKSNKNKENNNERSHRPLPKLCEKRIHLEGPRRDSEKFSFQEVNNEVVEMIEVGEHGGKGEGKRMEEGGNGEGGEGEATPMEEGETSQRQSRIFDETRISASPSFWRGSIGYSHSIDREKMKMQMVQNRKIAERMSPWKRILEIQKKLKRQPARRKFSLVHGLLTAPPRRNSSHHQFGRYLDESEATMTSPVRALDDHFSVYEVENSQPASLQSLQRKTL
ncbi:unnamed protein product, partial [Mesorhabditis belari]|uniref:Uncharacterized protein n=1 Tax=Mesorhabditis belari TaxID=2138241 RepID=A0AAF3EW57_9BILA